MDVGFCLPIKNVHLKDDISLIIENMDSISGNREG